MMVMAGVFRAITGLVAIFQNEFYVATRNHLFQSTPPPGAGSTWWSS
jgi:hypothetical protein